MFSVSFCGLAETSVELVSPYALEMQGVEGGAEGVGWTGTERGGSQWKGGGLEQKCLSRVGTWSRTVWVE